MKQRLDTLLVQKGLIDSRTKAQSIILAGQVFVNGQRRDKVGQLVSEDDQITVKELPRYVSRAGLKLESVAQKLGLEFNNKVVLDVGSSTGGFTDFALQHGAKKVYAVDVGTGQLAYKLRQDPRVVVMEKTDIRNAQLPEKVDVALADVSFISLRAVLPIVNHLVKPGGYIVAMVKPQFESDKRTADLHRGIIKNNTIRRKILKDFELWAKQYFSVEKKADSEVKGAKGNTERFYLLRSLNK